MNKQEIIEQSEFKDYLEIEALFNEFFKKLNFCVPHCITQKESAYRQVSRVYGIGGILSKEELDKLTFATYPGSAGCCYDDCYKNSNPEFEQERIKLYGKPQEKERISIDYKPCAYHTENGCLLESYKSPICISFACNPLEKFLEETYNIKYSNLETWKLTNLIITPKNERDQEYQNIVSHFKSTIIEFIRIVDEKNKK